MRLPWVLLLLDKYNQKKITEVIGYKRVITDGAVGLTAAVAVAMTGGIYIAIMEN